MPDDAELLRNFAATRSEAAFAELVRRHIDAVYSAALRRVGGDQHLAEDVTQHVFAVLARKAAVVARHPAPGAWLYVTTRNGAANVVRAEQRRKRREQEAAAMQDPDSAPDWRLVTPVLDRAMDELGETDRTALLLRFMEHKAFAEIGRALAVSEDAARMRVDRALDKLRLRLGRAGITSSSAALALALTQHAVGAAPAGLTAGIAATAASSAAAGGTSTAFLHAMTAAKSTAVIASVALVAALGTATHESILAHRADAEATSAEAAVAELRSSLARIAAEATTLESRQAELTARRPAPVAAATTAASRTGSSPANARPDARAEGRRVMEKYPAIRQAVLAWVDASTNYQYSGFYEAAGLNASEIAAFQRLRRAGLALTRSFGAPGTEVTLTAADGTRADAEAGLRELLGPERYRQYEEYSRTLPARGFSASLASALAYTPAPLTAGQFDAIAALLTRDALVRFGPTGPEYQWEKIASGVGNILSVEQQPGLEAVRLQAEYNRAYSRKSAALQANTPPKP